MYMQIGLASAVYTVEEITVYIVLRSSILQFSIYFTLYVEMKDYPRTRQKTNHVGRHLFSINYTRPNSSSL